MEPRAQLQEPDRCLDVEPGPEVSPASRVLAARPPGAQLWGPGWGADAWAADGWQNPHPSRTGWCSQGRGPPSGHPAPCPWAAPGVQEGAGGVTPEASRPSDPPEAGAVWHAGGAHRPGHLRLPRKNSRGLSRRPVLPAGPSWYVDSGARLSRPGRRKRPWKLLEGEACAGP